jgi:RES domain-containing protein
LTITSWRIVPARQAGNAFSGEGARLHGGRWNHRGTPVIYTAGSVSLAALEMLVHLEVSQLLNDYVCIPLTFGARLCRRLAAASLSPDWRAYPAPTSTRDLGTAWVRGARSVVLAVPSALVPTETNYLINPAHPDFSRVHIGSPEDFHFDPR